MFRNREDAALQLVQKLQKYKNLPGVVLAIPRGAVPMGYLIARELGFPLDIVLIKKIGYPTNPEFAIGAVGIQESEFTNYPGVSDNYIEKETIKIRQLLRDRYRQYAGDRKPTELKGKFVIVLDDGIATGNTMRATIKLIKALHPLKIVIAVPVAYPIALNLLLPDVDEIICLMAPSDFESISQFYEEFPQVSDQEVIYYLRKIWQE